MRVVDRRGDPPGRSAVNRERFIRRFKDEIKRAVDDEIEKRGIADVGKGSRISIPGRGLKEPHLNHDRSTGSRDFVLPGNREYLPGDTIERPDGGGDGGLGNEPGEGESRDNFSFVLSRDEFLRLFFDDLELPNLERTRLGDVTYVQKASRRLFARWRARQFVAGADHADVDRAPHCDCAAAFRAWSTSWSARSSRSRRSMSRGASNSRKKSRCCAAPRKAALP